MIQRWCSYTHSASFTANVALMLLGEEGTMGPIEPKGLGSVGPPRKGRHHGQQHDMVGPDYTEQAIFHFVKPGEPSSICQ